MSTMIIGLDLGQASDPSALAVLKRTPVRGDDGKPALDSRRRALHRADCVHLHRWPLGTPYPRIVQDVRSLVTRPELGSGQAPPRVAVDATGVGRAVIDMFLGAGLSARIIPVTITSGEGYRRDSWNPNGSGPAAFWVAKKELVSVVQAGLQGGSLKVVPSLNLADTLKRELMDFKVKVTLSANEQFGAWREGAHDDLVLAVALAAWLGEVDVPAPRSVSGGPGYRELWRDRGRVV